MKRIQFIAIGGSIMHSLAIVMKDRGYDVSGSDDEIYEPSRSRLQEKGLLPDYVGWRPDLITQGIDLVVLGMHARKENPELIKAKELGLKIQSFPEFIYDISSSKIRVVVAGSHGKTTTSGMLAHVLNESGISADRMIGASIGKLEPVAISDAGIIILEGDEYLSSPDDPRPKFLHYHPQITVITGIAWDHMNVFPTYQSYLKTFRLLLESLRKEDTLIFCADDGELVKLVAEISPLADCIPYKVHPYTIEDGIVSLMDNEGLKYPLKVFGAHNMQNIGAALLVSQKLGLTKKEFYAGIQSFEGANKRLQLLYKSASLTSYLDFAHAPSKVLGSVQAVREKHPTEFIIACLELHTFSSLSPDFLPQYRDSLIDANVKIVYYSPHTLEIKKLPDLSSELLSGFFNESDLKVGTSGIQLEHMITGIKLPGKAVLLWMSSGRFDGLDLEKVCETLDNPIIK